ncbi:MAG: response regulator transcription factor, partial [bacterium]
MEEKKRVVIIDDHSLMSGGVKAIIEREPGFAVVGEAQTAQEGLELTAETQPDIAIVDLSLPDRSGIDLTREILAKSPKTKILIVTMHCTR